MIVRDAELLDIAVSLPLQLEVFDVVGDIEALTVVLSDRDRGNEADVLIGLDLLFCRVAVSLLMFVRDGVG